MTCLSFQYKGPKQTPWHKNLELTNCFWDSLRPHGLQYTRLLCPSLLPGICSNSCPMSWWCYLIISSSASSLLLLTSIFLSIMVFSNEWLSHQVVKVLELQLQQQSFQWFFKINFLYDWHAWYLSVQGTLKRLLQHHNSKASIFNTQPSLWSNSHICAWLL